MITVLAATPSDGFEGRATTFTLLGSRRIIDKILKRSPGSDHTPNIGTLTMRGQRSEYLGSMPFDAALALPAIKLLGGFKYVNLSGIPIRGGTTQINYMSFFRNLIQMTIGVVMDARSGTYHYTPPPSRE